jgi:hypothetical protein
MSWPFPEKFLVIFYEGEDDAGRGGIQADRPAARSLHFQA